MSNVGQIKLNIEHNVARLATKDLKNAAKHLMEDFYATYSPIQYNRTDNLRQGTNIVSRTIRNKAIVTVNPSGVGQHKEASGHDVFEGMWVYGNRGLPPIGWRENGDVWQNPHYMSFTAQIPEFGISALSPDMAMEMLLYNRWDKVRQGEIDAIVNKELDTLELI